MPDTFSSLYKSDLLRAIETIDLAKVEQAIEVLKQARAAQRHIFVCGNGGSASTASHFACDMVKGASFGRESRFRIIVLTDSLPTITAYSNDVDYDCVFAEQLKNFAEPGDVVMAISGSGNSPNVLRAWSTATRSAAGRSRSRDAMAVSSPRWRRSISRPGIRTWDASKTCT